jgi:hypothetical protein
MTLSRWASAQPIKVSDVPPVPVLDICTSIEDTQEIVLRLKLCEVDQRELVLIREQSELKDQRIANLEKEIELLKREVDIQDRVIKVKDMEILAQVNAVRDLKDITDRAIKLAETSKPKSNWQLYGILGMAAFLLGLSVGL